jgi:SAM-dependent methyltransferase
MANAPASLKTKRRAEQENPPSAVASTPVRDFKGNDPGTDFDVSAVPLEPMSTFAEPVFVRNFNLLLKAGKLEAAAKYLVDQLESLGKSKLNRKEKLNHLLYMSRLIQRGGHTKHGYNKLLIKARIIERHIARLKPRRDGGFLDLGCGAHDPIALASYYYLNGSDMAYAVDLKPPRNEQYSALSMYDILANIKMFPERYCRAGVDAATLLGRLNRFPVDTFENGDFWGGLEPLADHIRYRTCDIAEAGIEPGSLSLLCSFAVLEHVSDLDGVCRDLYRFLAPGGLAFHFVDLADHRSYRGDGKFHSLSFLTTDAPMPNLNRIRAHDQLRAQREAGFEVISEERGFAPLTDEIRSQLLPRFAAMKDPDVSAIKLSMVLRKPAREV